MDFGCRDLRKRYGDRTVLDGLTFSCRSGDRLCLWAPSGGGKTTLLRVLAGLERLDGGSVTGFDRARIAMAFQEDRLCPRLSAVTNAALVQRRPDRDAIAKAMAEILPPECLRQPVGELSGGMRRRAAAARAALADSDVLLLDEPFAGLDGESRDRTARFLLSRQGGRLLLFTAHAPEEAALLDAGPLPLIAP